MVLAATSDKEHIQQMSNSGEDMLEIIKNQSGEIDKLVENNAKLTEAVSSKPIEGRRIMRRTRRNQRRNVGFAS